MKPVLAVTMGDPAGVGAEIIVKALSNKAVFKRAQPFVIGNRACLEAAMAQTGIDARLSSLQDPGEIDETDKSIQV
ncbi:MAG: 4-hydroxythreonine-4-phosphate dehydrogenase PdxA, partial [Pseudomonadales bacterium]